MLTYFETLRFRVAAVAVVCHNVVCVQDKICEPSDNSKSTNSAHSFCKVSD